MQDESLPTRAQRGSSPSHPAFAGRAPVPRRGIGHREPPAPIRDIRPRQHPRSLTRWPPARAGWNPARRPVARRGANMSRESYWKSDPSDVLRVGDGFRIDDVDPRSRPAFDGDKDAGKAALEEGAEILAVLQEQLFANSRMGGDERRILLVLQALDTAGKGGVVKHVMGAVDPQGVALKAFKKPTPEELEHDFLWRVQAAVPGPGMIGVFDRSHYEDVLIARVRELAPPEEIERRYDAINEFEAELAASGTTIIKCMLHISP